MLNAIKRWWYKGILPGDLIQFRDLYTMGKDLLDKECAIGPGDTLEVLAVSNGIFQVLCRVEAIGERDNEGFIPYASHNISAVTPGQHLFIAKSKLLPRLADQKLELREESEKRKLLDKAKTWTKAR